MVKNPLLLVLAKLGLIILLTDCRCNDNIIIKSVVVELPQEIIELRQTIDREKFAMLMEKAIGDNPHFYLNPSHDAGASLRLTMQLPVERLGNHPLLLMANLSFAGDGARELKSFADIKTVEGSVSGTEISYSMDKVLDNLFQLYKGIAADHAVYLNRIEGALKGENVDRDDLLTAIGVLGEAKETKAINNLIALLEKTDDLALGNAIVIALGEMKAAEGMEAIINFAERKPPLIRRQSIIAASRIASKLSAEWLLVMAYGYDDETTRNEAWTAFVHAMDKLGLDDN